MKHAANQHWINIQLIKSNKSQKSLSQSLGLDPGAMSRVLSGRRRLTIDEAIAMSQTFNVNLNEVLTNFGYVVSPENPSNNEQLQAENKKLKILVDALVTQIGGGK